MLFLFFIWKKLLPREFGNLPNVESNSSLAIKPSGFHKSTSNTGQHEGGREGSFAPVSRAMPSPRWEGRWPKIPSLGMVRAEAGLSWSRAIIFPSSKIMIPMAWMRFLAERL